MATIEVFNRQDGLPVDTEPLTRFAERALARVLESRAAERAGEVVFVLGDLPEIEVTIVSDGMIAEVHEKFLDDPEVTDVITFDHGEIVISIDTAETQAEEHGTTRDAELALYLLHGLLHLRGYDDRTPEAAAEMRAVQDGLFGELWGDRGE